jgi:DNA adenine methylase
LDISLGKAARNLNFRHPLAFRYPGGKFYALEILYPFWSSINHDEYREPLVGGGSVFFNKVKVRYNWLNDIDAELMTTYKILSDPVQREKLLDLLNKETASKERWREVFHFQPSNDLEIAYRYYYLNRTSFSGKLSSPAWGYRPKRSLPPERWHERIIPCGEKLEGVKITSEDFESVIMSPAMGSHVLMFIDPPYFKPPKNKHYRDGFNLEDHLRLKDALKYTKYKFFLTYDDVPEVRELYRWANIYEVRFFYRVDNSNIQQGRRQIGFELVITNYKIPKQLELA